MQVTVDDALVAEAISATGLPVETLVEEALRRIVRQQLQRQAVEELRGMGWEGDLHAMREGWSGPHR